MDAAESVEVDRSRTGDSGLPNGVAPEGGPPTRRTYELLDLTPGGKVIDVGCGPAADTIALGAVVGPRGSVVGIDADGATVEAADRLAARAGMARWVTHQVAPVTRLPFADCLFDGARSARYFRSLPDPRAALGEMIRVVCPGGRIVIADMCRAHTPSGGDRRAGAAVHELHGFLHDAGLDDVRIELHPLVVADPLLRILAGCGSPTASLTFAIASGTRT